MFENKSTEETGSLPGALKNRGAEWGEVADLVEKLMRVSVAGSDPAEGQSATGGKTKGRARGFLKVLGEALNAEGVVFWRLEGPKFVGQAGPHHRLVSGVFWFKDRKGHENRPGIHHLPIDVNNSGQAFATNEFIYGRDRNVEPDSARHIVVESEPVLPKEISTDLIFKSREIRALAATPVRTEKTDGVLTVYWRYDQPRLDSPTREHMLKLAATLWPNVYLRIRESRRLELVKRVERVLMDATARKPGETRENAPPNRDEANRNLQQICLVVGDLMHADEVTVFLAPLRPSALKWESRATSHGYDARTQTFRKLDLCHQPGQQRGITGWCLEHGVPLYVPNLHKFDEDRAWLRKVIPELDETLEWSDDLHLKEKDKDKKDPIRSFLIAPMIAGGMVVGVIRVCSKTTSPLICFSKDDLKTLSLVGNRIAHTWHNWQAARAREEEAKAWATFNSEVAYLPAIAQATGSSEELEELYLKVKGTILGACNRALQMWGTCELTQDEPPGSSVRSPVFDGEDTNQTYRWLSFREKFDRAGRAPHIQGLVQMAAGQLSVYRRLLSLVTKVQQSEQQVRRSLSDLRHQMINPLNMALIRINQVLRFYKSYSTIAEAFNPIRGLVRKAVNVANAYHQLVELEKTGQIKINWRPLNCNGFYKLLTEIVQDARLNVDPEQGLIIRLEENLQQQAKAERADLQIDQQMMEQVLNSLVENAIKYSNPRTTINLESQLNDGALVVRVSNRGARVYQDESELAVKRGWRSETAKKYVGEGTGIGLYLVNAIAKAHCGRFKLHPSTEQNLTVAEFVIPSITHHG